MLICLNPQYDYLKDWVSKVPELLMSERTTLYEGRNLVATLTTESGQTLCIKKYRTPRLLQRLVYTHLRKPKAERAYNNAIVLIENGIPTPAPVAYIIMESCGMIAESYLITEYCTYNRKFYEFREHSIAGYEQVVSGIASLAASMHEKGLYHKDFSPGNILYEMRDDHVEFAVIDINRMRIGKHIDLQMGCKNFERLWGDDEFFRYLAKQYATERGFDIEQTTKAILYYHRRFWRHRK